MICPWKALINIVPQTWIYIVTGSLSCLAELPDKPKGLFHVETNIQCKRNKKHIHCFIKKTFI